LVFDECVFYNLQFVVYISICLYFTKWFTFIQGMGSNDVMIISTMNILIHTYLFIYLVKITICHVGSGQSRLKNSGGFRNLVSWQLQSVLLVVSSTRSAIVTCSPDCLVCPFPSSLYYYSVLEYLFNSKINTIYRQTDRQTDIVVVHPLHIHPLHVYTHAFNDHHHHHFVWQFNVIEPHWTCLSNNNQLTICIIIGMTQSSISNIIHAPIPSKSVFRCLLSVVILLVFIHLYSIYSYSQNDSIIIYQDHKLINTYVNTLLINSSDRFRSIPIYPLQL
jgi:hypothetical protein